MEQNNNLKINLIYLKLSLFEFTCAEKNGITLPAGILLLAGMTVDMNFQLRGCGLLCSANVTSILLYSW